MAYPRVCYLSNGEPGLDMLRFLTTNPCELVFVSTDDRDPGWDRLPPYDLGLNFLGTRKVPSNHVNHPRLGWANFHPAPLPQFGGRNLAYHAIMTGANYYGATAHYMDEDFDTGPIIEVVRFDILPEHTAGDLWNKSVELLKGLFVKWVPELLRIRVPAMPITPGTLRYYSKSPIVDCIDIPLEEKRRIRALTFHPKHHAKIVIGGRTYKIVPEDA